MRMQPVLTREQARAITRGRTPLVPVEYESAVKALQSCITLDEAKYWGEKADALAAWAKIYRNDQVGIEARRLKLHAFRRMGELAQELRPPKLGAVKGAPQGSGTPPGSPSLLVKHGLRIDQANACSAIAKVPRREFEEIVALPKPPAPATFLYKFADRNTSDSWRILTGVHGGNSLTGFRSWLRGKEPKLLARALRKDEAQKARETVEEIVDWLDEFEEALPK